MFLIGFLRFASNGTSTLPPTMVPVLERSYFFAPARSMDSPWKKREETPAETLAPIDPVGSSAIALHLWAYLHPSWEFGSST